MAILGWERKTPHRNGSNEQNVSAHYTMMACHLTTNYRLSNSNRICLVCERYRVASCSSLSMVLPAVVVPDHSNSKLQFVNRRTNFHKMDMVKLELLYKTKTKNTCTTPTSSTDSECLDGLRCCMVFSLRYLPTQLNTLRLLRAINLLIV